MRDNDEFESVINSPEFAKSMLEWIDWKKSTPEFKALVKAKEERQRLNAAIAETEKE